MTWSISPQVGTISNGVYQAPATISTQQTVTVTATSVANSADTATATVTLIPVAVTVGPASAPLERWSSGNLHRYREWSAKHDGDVVHQSAGGHDQQWRLSSSCNYFDPTDNYDNRDKRCKFRQNRNGHDHVDTGRRDGGAGFGLAQPPAKLQPLVPRSPEPATPRLAGR